MTVCRRPGAFCWVLFFALTAALLTTTPGATAAEREHGAHVHGVGTLKVAIDGENVEIELESPGANIVGFEHDAQTDADRRAIREAKATLQAGDKMFAFPDAAVCRLTNAEVEAPSTNDHDEHKHDRHGKSEESHSEFHAHYRYRCDRPARLTHIDVNVFRVFAGTRELEVQAISPRGQRAQELTPDASRLKF